MTNKRVHSLISIFIAAVAALLMFAACTFIACADDSDARIIYASNDTDYSKEVSALSQPAPQTRQLKRSVGPAVAAPESRLLIVYDGELDLSGLAGLGSAVIGDNGLAVAQFSSEDSARAALLTIAEWDQVLSVEYDAEFSAYEAAGKDDPLPVSRGEAIRADGHFSWGIHFLGTDEYSDYVKSVNTSSLVVGVVDSGIDSSHSMFTGRLLPGYDFVFGDSTPQDEDGHGTHVAGTVVDCTQQATSVRIMPVKVLDEEGYGTISDISSGILYAAENGASVINVSIGGNHSSYLDRACQRAIARGAVLVVASGNEGRIIDKSRSCPAHLEEAVTVGAVSTLLITEPYSNYGSTLDVVAPGSDVTSAYPGNLYITWSGTSIAAPHVTACAALLRLAYPDASVNEISSLLKRSCKPYNNIKKYGKGVVNLKNLLADISDQQISAKSSFVYTGKAVKPKVTVSRNGEALFSGDDYTVTYSENTAVGKAQILINGKGSYYGKEDLYFTIVPKGTSIKSIAGRKRAFTVKWKKQVTQTTGYQIQYSTSSTFKSGNKTVLITKKSTVSKKVSNLKAGKKYYVRIRTYKNVNGKKYYSSWSAKKAVTTKQ